MEKTILHCDINNFYASVECLGREDLKGKAVAVCGSSEDRHGIVLAKNDVAKKFGVKTAEPTWEALKKCKDLIILSPHMEKYSYYSRKIREIYAEFTDLIEPYGMDECWLDVTDSKLLFGDGETIAYKIKDRVKKDFGITISVGVSFNKVFAKLGSDLKKPDAVTVIAKDTFKDIVWGLDASEMIGVGRATVSTLSKYKLRTIGDIAKVDISFMKKILGKCGEQLHNFANGIGEDYIQHCTHEEPVKSLGNSLTCKEDLTDTVDVFNNIYRLSESVCTRLRKRGLLAGGVAMHYKDNEFISCEKQAVLERPTRNPLTLAKKALELFENHYVWNKDIRAVGIRGINLVSEDQSIQSTLLADEEKLDELERLEYSIDSIRKKFGEIAVNRGSLLGKRKISHINTFPTTIIQEQEDVNK